MSLTPRDRWLLDAQAVDHPRRAGESWPHYIERLSLLAGILDRTDAVLVKPEDDLQSSKVEWRPPRLPFKDDE